MNTSGDIFTEVPWEGHTLYCALAPSGQQACILDVPNYWGQQNQVATPAAPALTTQDPTPQPFIAFNTRETRTGGGGAIELFMVLMALGIVKVQARKRT